MKIIIIDQPRADSSQINNKLWYIFIINKKNVAKVFSGKNVGKNKRAKGETILFLST